MKNQFINVSNLEMSELSVNELKLVNGGDGTGKITAGAACIVAAGILECVSGGLSTPLSAGLVDIGIGLIGSGIAAM